MIVRPDTLTNDIKTLAIIAGGGATPERLAAACEAQGIEIFIVAIDGQAAPEITNNRAHMWTRLGTAGTVIKNLKSKGVHDLVLIGSVRRPSLSEMIPDLKTLSFYARIGMKSMGDSDYLSALRSFLEEEGFRLHGAHKFARDMLAREGAYGAFEPTKDDWIDINRGLEIVRALGRLDVGQSAIVQEGFVLGVEAIEGTDELIRRCKNLKRKGRGGVLVKLCKDGQDTDLDLPTIGPNTVKLAAECGLAGIAIHAGQSLMIDPQEVAQIADQNKMFVIGVANHVA